MARNERPELITTDKPPAPWCFRLLLVNNSESYSAAVQDMQAYRQSASETGVKNCRMRNEPHGTNFYVSLANPSAMCKTITSMSIIAS